MGIVDVAALAANAVTVASRDDDVNLTMYQIVRQRWQPVVLTFGPAKFDLHVPAFNVACLL